MKCHDKDRTLEGQVTSLMVATKVPKMKVDLVKMMASLKVLKKVHPTGYPKVNLF